MLLDYFPGKPRQIQIDILSQVQEALDSGYHNIIINAPPGCGKSFLAATIAKYLKEAYILTATTDLQDQYSQDFPWMATVRGKSHFSCVQLDKEATCDKGICHDPTSNLPCSYKPDKKNFIADHNGLPQYNTIMTSELCSYYYQKYAGLVSHFSVYNYAEFFSSIYSTRDLTTRFGMIMDEAHSIEDNLVGFLGINLAKSHTDFLSMELPNHGADIDKWTEFISELKDSYSTFVSVCKSVIPTSPYHTRYNSRNMIMVQSRLDKISYILNELKHNRNNFVVSRVETYGNLSTAVSIQPIDIGKYVKNVLRYGNVNVFLSATIDNEVFCRSIGIRNQDCAYIRVPKSPFPVENRPVYFLDVAKVSKANLTNVMPMLVHAIDHLLTKHCNEKGIILTTSYNQVEEITKGISKHNVKRLRKTDADVVRSDLIDIHRKSDLPTVLISPSLYVGVDLKDDQSRFQIIVKTPYGDLSDGRISAKLKKDPLWYSYQGINKLIQGCGRSIRHENDYSVTYVLDSNAHALIQRSGYLAPEWFKESIISKKIDDI